MEAGSAQLVVCAAPGLSFHLARIVCTARHAPALTLNYKVDYHCLSNSRLTHYIRTRQSRNLHYRERSIQILTKTWAGKCFLRFEREQGHVKTFRPWIRQKYISCLLSLFFVRTVKHFSTWQRITNFPLGNISKCWHYLELPKSTKSCQRAIHFLAVKMLVRRTSSIKKGFCGGER